MGIYTEDSLQQLRQRIDLAEVLSAHLDLKRSGSSFKALCPFHDEKTPSFIIHKGDSHYHCFGCGAHGDAIAFLMGYLKMSFTEAIESLAERFHVKLEQLDKVEKKESNKPKLKDALAEAKNFYHFYLLHTEEGHEALHYLYARGIDLAFVNLFEIGFSPKTSGLFLSYMKQKGFDETILKEAGLLSNNAQGKIREFFFNRVMFPIKDSFGHVVGFSARKIKEDTFGPKYINTPETPLFKKSQILYGLSECRRRIAKEKRAIIVEGQIDTLRLIQEGFDLTVAGQGTAFTEEHAHELIKLGVQKIFIVFDGDEAGRQGAIKVGDFFQKEGIEVSVVRLEDKQDPDSLLREKGSACFIQALQNGIDYLQFLVQEYSKTVSIHTPSGKNQLAQLISQKIKQWNHPLMVHESLKKLAELLQVPERFLDEGYEKAPEVVVKKSEHISKHQIDPNKVLETDFLRWILLFGDKDRIAEIAMLNISIEALMVPICKKIYEVYLAQKSKQASCDLLSIGGHLDSNESQDYLSEMMHKKVNAEKAKEGALQTIQKILERNWLYEREEVRIKIHNGRCSEDEIYELVKRFDELKKQPPKIILP